VLRVLEREGIPIDYLAGTSMGGLIAAGYAAGLSPAEMEAEALRMSEPRQLITLFDRSLPDGGIFRGRNLEDYLGRVLGDTTFEASRVPLALVTVDLNSERKVVLREGRLRDAVRATVAFPGLFAPVARGEQLLVDGGLLDNLPADVVRHMGADVVIAVSVSTDARAVARVTQRLYGRRFMPRGLVDILEVLWRSVQVMMCEIDRHCLEAASTDLVIGPDIPPSVTVFTGFDRAGDVIAAGERAAQAALPRLRDLLRGS
jgi:NTE family protein